MRALLQGNPLRPQAAGASLNKRELSSSARSELCLLRTKRQDRTQTSPNANKYLETNTQTFDTLVKQSCGTLSRDTFVTLRSLLQGTLVGHSCGTLVGHSRTTLTYSDVFWPDKLTVHSSQKFLPVLHLVLQSCQFYSSQSRFASRTTFVLPSGQF